MADEAEEREEPQFALTPARHNMGILDYGTSEGIKVYRAATAKLSDEPFDCETAGLRNFLNLVRDRAIDHGWDASILGIPNDIANPLGDVKDFLNHYSEITLTHIREHVATYQGNQVRAARDAVQLYTCLMNSLSNTGQQKVTIHRAQYNYNGVNNGVLLLKTIIQVSHIDTNATTTWIRTELSNLDLYLPKVGSDITKLNDHVSSLLEQLRARGETTNDLFTHLLKGYKAANDRKFVEYIEKKEEEYEDGQAITPEQLMELAENRFKVLKQKGVWSAPSPEVEKILALEAKIQRLVKQQGKTKKKEKSKNKDKSNSNSNSDSNKNNKGNRENRKKPDWMLKAPTDDEKGKPKTVNGKEYWYCPNHKCWCRHKPEDCRGVGTTPALTTEKDNKKKLKLAKALQTVTEESDSEHGE